MGQGHIYQNMAAEGITVKAQSERTCTTSVEMGMVRTATLPGEGLQDWLDGLVGDGVRDLQPHATNANGQLYTIHGVMANFVGVPSLFAITTRRNERVYERIFGRLKEAIEAAGGGNKIRILLDYEKAAINAAKRLFEKMLG